MMAIYCPECGEQILSRRAGFCPGCHQSLPDGLRMDESAKELMDTENERARHARFGRSGGGVDGGFGWSDGGCDGGGGCGGD